jgi:hypothetical protein
LRRDLFRVLRDEAALLVELFTQRLDERFDCGDVTRCSRWLPDRNRNCQLRTETGTDECDHRKLHKD